MQLEHSFAVPVPVADAWPVLLDVERIAPCMPGATLETVDGDEFTGKVKVKVGPITVTYRGSARFVEKDEAARKVVLDASGKEARGSGTAKATVTATLHDAGGRTEVTVVTDLAVTGKPAQFGRGVMADVGGKLIGLFADCLAEEIAQAPAAESKPAAAAGAAGAAEQVTETAERTVPAEEAAREAVPAPEPATAVGPTTGAGPRPVPPAARRTSDTIDLLETAGSPVLKRVAPVGAALLGLLVFLLWRRRR